MYTRSRNIDFVQYSLLRGDRSRRGIESDEGRRSNNRIQYSFLSNDPFVDKKWNLPVKTGLSVAALLRRYTRISSLSFSFFFLFTHLFVLYRMSVVHVYINGCITPYTHIYIIYLRVMRIFYVKKIARIARLLTFLESILIFKRAIYEIITFK